VPGFSVHQRSMSAGVAGFAWIRCRGQSDGGSNLANRAELPRSCPRHGSSRACVAAPVRSLSLHSHHSHHSHHTVLLQYSYVPPFRLALWLIRAFPLTRRSGHTQLFSRYHSLPPTTTSLLISPPLLSSLSSRPLPACPLPIRAWERFGTAKTVLCCLLPRERSYPPPTAKQTRGAGRTVEPFDFESAVEAPELPKNHLNTLS